MAVIATLRPVEQRQVSDTYSTASIPLNKLVPWDGNVRKTGAEDDIGELVASIEALGILQSLIVKKASRGRFTIIAGQRRYRAACILVEQDKMAFDAPIPCQIVPSGADATEISLTENVVRAPMHPADQFEAFRDLVDAGSTPVDIAARFGMSETAVKQRLRLARVSPAVFQAYKDGELSLEQVQAFAVSDDHAAQDAVLENCPRHPRDIRSALTRDEIRGTDKRARFVTVAAYEEAGGAVRRDLFAEGDEGVFLLDSQLLDRLALDKLRTEAETVKAEGWKWVETALEVDRSEMDFRVRRPEPLPLSEEAQAEHRRLSEEYTELFDQSDEPNEETSERLDAIEERIAELEDTEVAYAPEVLAIAGAIVTLGHDGKAEILRGLVKPEDESEADEDSEASTKERPEFSAALVESLTAQKSAAISATLCASPQIALAAVVHALAVSIFGSSRNQGSLQIAATVTRLKEYGPGVDALEDANARWAEEKIPAETEACWQWCLAQDCEKLLSLLAYCAARTVNAVQTKGDRPDASRLAHVGSLATSLGLDMKQWFTPTAENFFRRVGRQTIVNAIVEATGKPAKRSWQKLKKAELAALAERETAGTGWLPPMLRA